MRPDHRHELKTNELAEWLTHLPQWANENRTYIILVSAFILAFAALYIWRLHSRDITVQKQLELTSLAGQLLTGKAQILQAQEQGKDISFILLQTAESLRILAENTEDNQMSAFAFIKQGEALRTELHYRLSAYTEQESSDQLSRAKASYAKALEICPDNPLLTSAAKLGLGLCEEDLGNFEMAEQIYRDITTNPDFEGTVAATQAKARIETMGDYKQKLVFKPAPKMPVIEFTEPADTNTPDVNLGPISPNAIPEVSNINDTNQVNNSRSEMPDAG